MAKEWLTLEQAGARLGLSVRAVRRRVKRGRLNVQKQQIPQGFRYWVLFEDPDECAGTEAGDLRELRRVVMALQSGQVTLRQALVRQQEAIDRATFVLQREQASRAAAPGGGVAGEPPVGIPAAPLVFGDFDVATGLDAGGEPAGLDRPAAENWGWDVSEPRQMRRENYKDQRRERPPIFTEVEPEERLDVLRLNARRRLRPWWLRWVRSA